MTCECGIANASKNKTRRIAMISPSPGTVVDRHRRRQGTYIYFSYRFGLSHQGLFHVVPTAAARGYALSPKNSLQKDHLTLGNDRGDILHVVESSRTTERYPA